jgi:hypothetical protein
MILYQASSLGPEPRSQAPEPMTDLSSLKYYASLVSPGRMPFMDLKSLKSYIDDILWHDLISLLYVDCLITVITVGVISERRITACDRRRRRV